MARKYKENKMSRLGMYMVYNPKKGKPVKYYKNYDKAVRDAEQIRIMEKEDVLVLKVVAIAQSGSHCLDEIKENTGESKCLNCESNVIQDCADLDMKLDDITEEKEYFQKQFMEAVRMMDYYNSKCDQLEHKCELFKDKLKAMKG